MHMKSLFRGTVVLMAVALLATGCASKKAYTDAAEQDAAAKSKQPVAQAAPAEEATPAPATSTKSVSTTSIAEEAADSELLARVMKDGMLRIHFDFDQYTLGEESRSILAANAAYLSRKDSVSVLIEGHCDERGSDEYNLALGERRALAAKNYLVSLGVDEDRLSIITYGEEKPLDAGHSESSWSKNRRAEFLGR